MSRAWRGVPGKGRVVKSADVQIQMSYRYQEIAAVLRGQIQAGILAVETLLRGTRAAKPGC
jgi:hypothetical protein